FKDLLDKLGIEVQLIRHGKFKAAAEQFIANTISKENMEQNKVMLNSIWGTWVKEIGESRNIAPEKINSLIDDLQLGLAPTLVTNGLIDELVTRDAMTKQLCTLYGVTKEKDLKIISISNYAKATVKPDAKVKDKIAVIYASGEITMDAPDGLSVKKYYPIISKIRKDSSIKGVVLRVDSPGGDAQAAEILNDELQLLRKDKPLVVSMGNYAASGGYWIAAQSDRIFTDNTTLTGSIGVFSLSLNYGKGLKEHLNINSVAITTNKHSDMGSGMRPLDSAEEAYMQGFVEKIYTQFTDLVANGRNLPVAYVDSVGQGRVWAGVDAIKLKLADECGGLIDAIDYTSKLAGLENYKLAEYPVAKTSIEKLMETLNSAESNAKILANPYALLEKTYSKLKTQNGTQTYARLPYIYEFNY
ncbi:MAG: signal peptide peptidase SppA, partial [Bacteroidales bacterium]